MHYAGKVFYTAEGFVGKRAVVSRSFAINELTTRRFAGDGAMRAYLRGVAYVVVVNL